MDISSGKIQKAALQLPIAASNEMFRLEPASGAPSVDSPAVSRMTPPLVAQVERNRATPIAEGEPWPTGWGVNSLSSKIRSATPTELWHLAPKGMDLNLQAGFNVTPPTEVGKQAARNLGLMSHLGFGMLATEYLREYVSGQGVDQELSKRNTNKLLGDLMDSSKSVIDTARPFMDANINQMREYIERHIAETGEKSGSFSSVTDWRTTTHFDFRNSLGNFSGKLLYDVEYSTKEDGTIEVEGIVALAVQDLYDFGNNMLPISIPTWLLPKEFTSRPGHLDEEGSLTDLALAGLQQEGLAKPFYVYGVSDIANIEMTLHPNTRNSWKVTQ